MKSRFSLTALLLSLATTAHAGEAKPGGPLCVDTGRVLMLGTAAGYNLILSSDKTKLISGPYDQPSFRVVDISTGQGKDFEKPANTTVALLAGDEVAFTEYPPGLGLGSPSPSQSLAQLAKLKTTIIHIGTGQRRFVMGQMALGDELVTPVRAEGDEIVLKGAQSGREFRRVIANSHSDTVRVYGEKGLPDIAYDKKSDRLSVQIDGVKRFSAKTAIQLTRGNSLEVRVSKDRRTVVAMPERELNLKKILIVDTQSGRQQTVEIPDRYNVELWQGDEEADVLSPDGRKLVLRAGSLPNDGLKILDLRTGKIETRKEIQGFRAGFRSSGEVCVENPTHPGTDWACYHPSSGKEVSRVQLAGGFSVSNVISSGAVAATIWNRAGEGTSFLFSSKTTCPKVIVPVECNCLLPKSPPLQTGLDAVKDLAIANACAKDFNAKDWANLPSANLDLLDEQSSLTLLKRFSKPGGFDPERHTGVLLGMLKAGMHKGYPAQFRSAMLGVLHSSNRLYDTVHGMYPELAQGEAGDTQCQTPNEREVIAKTVWAYAKMRLKIQSSPEFTELEPILSASRDVLSKAQKEKLAEDAADELVISAGDSQDLNQVFSSKVYKFAESKTRQALGLPFKDLTDVTVVRDQNELRLIQLGTEPFAGSTPTLAGFHSKLVKTIAVASIPAGKSKETVSWTYGKDASRFEANVVLRREQIDRPLVSTAKAPDYKEMWKGKVLRGVIVAGANLGSGLTDRVTKSYIEYYTKEGFVFGEAKVENNIADYLEKKVSGDEPMHYFVKEAHSDGDEKNLFRMSTSGKILTGVRMVDGKREIVDIVFPGGDTSSTLISNQDFGRWMKARDKAKMPELVYLNSSCWSKSKAIYEISAAATPKLINIPTTTSMVVFANHEKNVMRAAVDGIRKGKTYEEIRSAMQNDPGYQSGRKNVFIFPDQEAYNTNIVEVLRTPVDVDMNISKTKPGGKPTPYSIEGV